MKDVSYKINTCLRSTNKYVCKSSLIFRVRLVFNPFQRLEKGKG